MIPIHLPSEAEGQEPCALCGRLTGRWTALPDRQPKDQVACCKACGEAREPEDVPTKEEWFGEVSRTNRKCPVYSQHCPEHGFFHGAEAEELREGIEAIIEQEGDEHGFKRALRALLDRVDARDSLAYLEAKKAEAG